MNGTLTKVHVGCNLTLGAGTYYRLHLNINIIISACISVSTQYLPHVPGYLYSKSSINNHTTKYPSLYCCV